MLADIDAQSVLEGFIADEVIDEVVGLVKAGKEAVVYLTRKRARDMVQAPLAAGGSDGSAA